MKHLRELAAGLTLVLAVGLTLAIGCSTWMWGGAAWASLFDSRTSGKASAGPFSGLSAGKSNTGRRHAAAAHHRAHRHSHHLARHHSRHAYGFAGHLRGLEVASASDQEMADDGSQEAIGALVPAWVATPNDGLSEALAASPARGFDLVAEWNRAVGEISAVGAVPTETLRAFNDFPPGDAVVTR